MNKNQYGTIISTVYNISCTKCLGATNWKIMFNL